MESAPGDDFAASAIDPAAADGRLIKPKRYDGGEFFGALSLSLTAHFSIVAVLVLSSLLKYCLPAAPPTKAVEKVDVKLVELEQVVPPVPAHELGVVEAELVAPKVVAIKGPSKKKSPDRARAAAIRDAREFGMIGLLRASESPDLLARLDSAPDRIEGGVLGGLVGESHGVGGLGLVGTGQGGGRANPIAALLRARSRDMQSCFKKAIAKDPTFQGRTVLSIRIAEDGSIASLSMRPKLDAELDACLEDVVRSIDFPKEAASVTFPMRFVVQ